MTNEGDCIATKKMKAMHVESTCDEGMKVFLGGSLCLVEGFSTHDDCNTDYSSYPNLLATRPLL